MSGRYLICFLSLIFLPAEIFAEDYWVGFGRAKITPTESVWMSGYAGRRQGAQAKLDDLFVQTMVVQDRDGARALLVRIDVCVMRDTTVTQICDLIGERTGLMRRQIMVNVSHTHSGPAVDELYHYPMSTEHRERLAGYMERIKAQCADAAEAAIQDLAPAHLEYGSGEAHFFHNRRGLDENGRYTGMIPNPDNHTDRVVPVLKVSDLKGDIRGVVYGVACHCVTLGVNYEISADYAGYARMQLEKEIPNALFVTGCGADANPIGGENVHEIVRQHGADLADEVTRVVNGEMKSVKGFLQTQFRYVDLPLVSYESRSDIEEMREGPYADVGTTDKLFAILSRGARIPQYYSAPFAVWKFGEDLTWVGLPEEAVSEYVPLLKQAVPQQSLWISGYCNDVSGYLPTKNIMKQGGYETRGLISETAAGWFAPEVENVVIDSVVDMVEAANAQWKKRTQPTPVKTYFQWQHRYDQLDARFQAVGDFTSTEKGLHFNAQGYLEGTPLKLVDATTEGLTLAAWVRPDAAGMEENRMIVCQWANQVDRDCFGLSLNFGKPSVGVGDGRRGEHGFTSDMSVVADRWSFVVATWNPETRQYRTYIDGQLTGTTGRQTGNGLNLKSETTLKIGAQATEGVPRFFIGKVDRVWIGNCLNQAAIRTLYNEQKQGYPNP